MARMPRWMVVTDERIVSTADGGKALQLTITLKWWRWFDPSFWWAAIRGARR